MNCLMLGCGPYFDEGGAVGSLILFLLVKPLAYFAFIQAFRYRVSRPIPMRYRQAAWLAALRTVMGIVIVGSAALGLMAMQDSSLWVWSWAVLYGERLFSWWIVGRYGAQLRGRRLLGWIISGTCINAAFDVAVVWGMMEGALPQVAIVAAIGMFIFVLDKVGRRGSLKSRFACGSSCAACSYDLTGNLSGRCPECGTMIGSEAISKMAA